MEKSSYQEYILHGNDDSPDYVMTKVLLEHYGISYRTSDQGCEEWPEELAIYGITASGKQELIGGYTSLCGLLPEGLL